MAQRRDFLLMGQSNMAGRGDLLPPDLTPVPGVTVLDGQATPESRDPLTAIQWRPAAHPLHLNEPHKAQFGLGLDFAVAYGELSPGPVGLIPGAWGGLPISQLGPGTPLFDNALDRVAVAARTGRLCGVLWHQGESDTAADERAGGYGGALAALLAELRSRSGRPRLPFVVGDLAEGYGAGADPERLARIAAVRQALRALGDTDPDAGWVSSAGLPTADDGTHLTRAALKEFGRRYATVMASLTE